ncbi:MAG: inorganic phosphate transporter [Bacillota bacterium]|nr:inorganic phosphate transporter [Bacillota bacterium]
MHQYLQYFLLLSGLFLGWSLGTNDAGSVFGAAVSTRVIRYKTAVILISVFVIVGACTSGYRNITKVSGFANANGVNAGIKAFLVLLAAGLTVTAMSYLKIPISANQCIVGSIFGWGISCRSVDMMKTGEFLLAWVVSPVIAAAFCFLLTYVVTHLFERQLHKLFVYDAVIKIGYLAAGIFASYTMGANNVANVTGLFVGPNNLLPSSLAAAAIGSGAIALGVLTYSKKVMTAIGSSVTRLTDLSGLMVVLSSAAAIFTCNHFFGLPVPTANATVGAMVGAGLVKGAKNVNFKVFKNILTAWVVSPTAAGLLTFLMGITYKAIEK